MPVTPTPTPSPTPTPTPTVPLTGTGSVFARMGAFGTTLDDINTSRGTTIPTDVTAINAQFLSADQSVINNLYSYLSSYQNSAGNFNPNIRTMANGTVIAMVTDVQPQPQPTLQSALVFIIAQMVTASQTIKANGVSALVTSGGSNVGNPVVAMSLYDVNGKLLEYSYAETIFGSCTNDSLSFASLAGSEPVLFQGQPAVGDMTSQAWPAGSGCTLATTAVNPLVSGGLNWTVNGSMESFLAGTPTGWHVVTGTPDGTLGQSTAANTFYDGASSLVFTGITGGENTELQQQFRTSLATGDMTQTLYPLTQFAVNFWLQPAVGLPYGMGGYGDGGYGVVTLGSSITGTLRVALVNGSGTVINDAAGTPNSLSINLAGLGSGWTSETAFFRLPANLPSAVYLDFKLTTPLADGNTLYVDRIGLARMPQAYAGGPFVSVFSGSTNMAKGDSFQLIVNNTYAGKFQKLFWRLFAMPSLGLILPSAASPTIADY